MTLTAVTRTEPERDRFGRPMILCPDGATLAYTRCTTFAKALDDGSALSGWKQRMALFGMSRRPDLQLLAGTTPLDDRKAWDGIAASAMEAAASASAANIGTALHQATELVDLGGPLDQVPPAIRPRVEAYLALLDGHQVLDVETFVVCDELRVAGTFDRLLRLPDGRVVIADIKTGRASSVRYAAGSWAVQTAIYARGRRYDPATGQRSSIHPDLDPDLSVVVHLPEDGDPALIHLRADWGWQAAQLAARVRRYRTTRFIVDPQKGPTS